MKPKLCSRGLENIVFSTKDLIVGARGKKEKKKIENRDFFLNSYPLCSVSLAFKPLYVALLISFSLIFRFFNTFLQIVEKEKIKPSNRAFSKHKLLLLIPYCLRFCSQLEKKQIETID